MDSDVVVQVEAPVYVKGEGALELSFFTYPLTLRLPILGATRQCTRRYSDFDALRNQLSACYWACIVPPLPEKESALDQLSKRTPLGKTEGELLEYRRHGLRRFLRAVAQHTTLSQSPLIVKFVDDVQWRQCLREPVRPPHYVTPSLTEGLTKSLLLGSAVTREVAAAAYTRVLAADNTVATTAMTTTTTTDTPGVALVQPHVTVVDTNNNSSSVSGSVVTDAATWEAARVYIGALEAELRRLRERVHALVQRRRATGLTLSEFGDAFAAIAETSGGAGGGSAVSMTVNNNSNNSTSMGSSGSGGGGEDAGMRQAALALQQRSHTMCDAYADQAEQEQLRVMCALGFYAGMCAAVLETLRRVQTAAHHPAQLARRAHELEVLLGKGGGATMTVDEARAELAVVQEQQQRLASELRDAAVSFAREFAAFHRDEVAAMHTALRSYSSLALSFADKLADEWALLKTTVDELTMT